MAFFSVVSRLPFLALENGKQPQVKDPNRWENRENDCATNDRLLYQSPKRIAQQDHFELLLPGWDEFVRVDGRKESFSVIG